MEEKENQVQSDSGIIPAESLPKAEPKVEPKAEPEAKPKSAVEQIMKAEPKKDNSKKEENKENEEQEKKQNKFVTFILDLGLNLLIVFGLVYVIQTFIASPFKVFGPSMCNTLNYIEEECQQGYGEYIIVNKLVYKNFFGWSLSEPSRGDIVVFHPPHTDKDFFIKRIIGVPGDTIKLIDGKVFLFNDEYETGYELPEDYLSEENQGKTIPSTNRVTTFEVPEGKLFLMGDNRNHSTDSRSCFRDAFQGGCRGEEGYFLDRDHVEGRAWVVLWPFNLIRMIDRADYFK